MNETVIRNTDDLIHLLRQNKPSHDVHLGDILVEESVITRQQLQHALIMQQRDSGKHLGKLLTEMGVATQKQINTALAHKLGIPSVKVGDYELKHDVLSHVPADISMQYNILPLAEIGGCLIVAMENPLDWSALAAVRFNTKLRVEPVIASGDEIRGALHQYYSKFEETDALEELDFGRSPDEEDDSGSVHSIEQEAMQKPIVRLVNAIILQAVTRRASDINIRPEKDKVNVYYRIDGKLQFLRTLRKSLLPALVSRIKITGQMNIAERRLPQDGHARLIRGGNSIDLRISVIPTVAGESVVIRILDKQAGLKSFDTIGLQPRDRDLIRPILGKSFGMFLVTGPTGSGKSTTLYSLLNEITKRNPHIITVEDPVEYDMDGIEQIQINIVKGYTFAEALKHILRHDPDVIMIGEIRDLETARIANKAALTGHLMLSTLHTNDAASTVTRLIDMGVEPYLLSSTLQGVLAQRLIRLNCIHCKEVEPFDPLVRSTLGVSEDEVFYRGKGCEACNLTGYSGRTMAYELLTVTPEMTEFVSGSRTTAEIKTLAIKQGMVTLTDCALRMARSGITSLEEAYSVRLE